MSVEQVDAHTHFGEVYRRYAPMVFKRCRQLLRDDDLAAEAMQDVFVRLLSRYQPAEVKFPSSLLYHIATRICLNRIRDAKKHSHNEHPDLLERISIAADAEPLTLISLLLDRLFHSEPPSTRTMAVMHYVDGLSHQEIAQEFHMSAIGIKKRLQRFRQRHLLPKENPR